MGRQIVKEIVASTTETSSSNSGNLKNTANSLPVSADAHVRLVLNCTAFTGSQLDVALEHSLDAGTTWNQAAAFAPLSATGSRELRFKTFHDGGDAAAEQSAANVGDTADANDGAIAKDHRIAWSVNGDPTFSATFKVEAVIQERSY